MTEPMSGERRVVVGVDGSPQSKLALRWAARIAEAEAAVVEVVAAWEFPPASGWAVLPEGYSPKLELDKIATEAVDEVFGADRPVGMTIRSVQGHPAAVLARAGRGAVMLVVGSRGHGGFMGLLLGSVSAKVAEHATCPVLVVHDEPEQSGSQEATS